MIEIFDGEEKIISVNRLLFNRPCRLIGGIEMYPFFENHKILRKILRNKRSYILNSEDWGLSNEILPEFYIRKASWDQ